MIRSTAARTGMAALLLWAPDSAAAVQPTGVSSGATSFRVLAAQASSCSGGDSTSGLQRSWTSETSLGIRYIAYDLHDPIGRFGGLDDLSESSIAERAFSVSPDGRYAFFVCRRSDPVRDTVIVSLRVVDLVEIERVLSGNKQPAISSEFVASEITMASARRDDMAAIRDARWSSDSRSIYFRGVDGNRPLEAYRLDVQSQALTRLFSPTMGELWYFAARGDLAFAFEGILPGNQRKTQTYPLQTFAYGPRPDGGQGRAVGQPTKSFKLLRYLDEDRSLELPSALNIVAAEISPTGDSVLTRSASSYSLVKVAPDGSIQVSELANTSFADSSALRQFWTADGRSLLMFEVASSPSIQALNAARSIATFVPSTGTWQVLDRLSETDRVELIRWDETKGQISYVVVRGSNESRRSFSWNGKSWRSSTSGNSSHNELRLRVEEGAASPQMVTASMGDRKINLLAIDSVFSSSAFQKPSVFHWTDFSGRNRTASLTMPDPEKVKGRVPIVIQLSYDLPGLFLPDGFNTTVDSAQSLAARGIGVLQVGIFDLIDLASLKIDPSVEAELVQRHVEWIVDALIGQGLVDPAKIGISGFSRTGYYTNFIITHPERSSVAAAVVGDSFMETYPRYLSAMAKGETSPAAYMGGRSFWNAPRFWLKYDAWFNVDRSNTPTWFLKILTRDEAEDEAGAEQAGAWTMTGKPFDYVLMNGGHNLRNPAQRKAAMDAVVDWFSFWLLGEEDSDPAKAGQYSRWRAIRKGWIDGTKATPEVREGFLLTRSGMSFRLETRATGISPLEGDTVRLRYSVVGGGEATGPQILTIKFGAVTVGLGDLDADRVGLKGLDECVRFMRVGETATCIYPSSRIRNGGEERKGAGVGASTSVDRVRYSVELLDIVRSGERSVH